jgi:hypothetical protein
LFIKHKVINKHSTEIEIEILTNITNNKSSKWDNQNISQQWRLLNQHKQNKSQFTWNCSIIGGSHEQGDRSQGCRHQTQVDRQQPNS